MVGELCFHTAMTGYQEVMTDPSFARQVVAFTFPHIGNVGANADDLEASDPHALGCIVLQQPTAMDFGYTFTVQDPDGHRVRVFAPAGK